MPHQRLGINVHQAGEPALRLAASLGVSVIRVDANWPDLQPAPDQWTWDWLDTLIATARNVGLEVYCSLSQTPHWVSPNRGDLPPLYHWEHFCREFARHYTEKLTFVGCWNEWPGDATTYVDRLLRPMAGVFRSVNARYQICGPDCDTERDWPAKLRTILTRGGDCLNILTVHCYADNGALVWQQLTQVRKWWELWKKPSIKEVIHAAGWHGLTWLTETGWRSDRVGEDGQAQRWDQFLERLMGSAWPAGVCAFNLIDEAPPDRPLVTWGMFRADGTPKPAAEVLRRYAGRGVV